jgi:hypothetical protein
LDQLCRNTKAYFGTLGITKLAEELVPKSIDISESIVQIFLFIFASVQNILWQHFCLHISLQNCSSDGFYCGANVRITMAAFDFIHIRGEVGCKQASVGHYASLIFFIRKHFIN